MPQPFSGDDTYDYKQLCRGVVLFFIRTLQVKFKIIIVTFFFQKSLLDKISEIADHRLISD